MIVLGINASYHDTAAALVTLLTTGLDHLVVDDFWITRREPSDERWLDFSLSIAECADVVTAISPGPIVTRICYRHQVGLAAGPPIEVGELLLGLVLAWAAVTALRRHAGPSG